MEQIQFYGASWCPDCKRSRAFLDQHNVPYNYIDIETTEGAADKVAEINGGMRKIPTIIFNDQTVLVEPTNKQLAEKLAIIS